jgi:integrase
MVSAPPRLLDRVRAEIRARHYSRRTEEAYVHWIRRFILFHDKRHPADMGGDAIAAFLSSLATRLSVAASTQNQALSALTFLYREVLGQDPGEIAHVPRARSPVRVPVVLGGDEVRRVLTEMSGTPALVASLLYGAGFRLQECLELRVKDVDFDRHEITVRRGKGQKDRRVMLPEAVRGRLGRHLEACSGFIGPISPAASGASFCRTRLRGSVPVRRPTGGGSLCSLPGGSARIRDSVPRRGTTCTSR